MPFFQQCLVIFARRRAGGHRGIHLQKNFAAAGIRLVNIDADKRICLGIHCRNFKPAIQAAPIRLNEEMLYKYPIVVIMRENILYRARII